MHSLVAGLTFGALVLAAGGARAQDLAAGKAIFAARCSMCHQVDSAASGPVAPSLRGVVGRRPGSLPDFHYSAALKAKGGKWTVAELQTFLASPQRLVPGTLMVIVVPDPKDRADVVAYLKSAK